MNSCDLLGYNFVSRFSFFFTQLADMVLPQAPGGALQKRELVVRERCPTKKGTSSTGMRISLRGNLACCLLACLTRR